MTPATQGDGLTLAEIEVFKQLVSKEGAAMFAYRRGIATRDVLGALRGHRVETLEKIRRIIMHRGV